MQIQDQKQVTADLPKECSQTPHTLPVVFLPNIMEITLFFLLRVSHVVTSAYFKHGSDFNKLVTILNPRTISRKQRILSYDSTNDFSGCWNHTTCFR